MPMLRQEVDGRHRREQGVEVGGILEKQSVQDCSGQLKPDIALGGFS